MLHNMPNRLGLAAAAVLLAAQASSAAAKDRRPDVDIDELKGDIWRTRAGWTLRIRCEVDIEDARRRDRFELIFRLTERGREVVDGAGYPVEIVVALDRPTEIDDDELEFKEALRVKLPRHYIRDPKHLRLHARVAHAGGDRPLDRKDKSVKYRRPKD